MNKMLPELKEFDERLSSEAIPRSTAGDKILKFGVSFLDDVFGGIYTDDLVVMGAKTGLGKTQLAMNIARVNAADGKRVVYFALEASEYEIERRIKYQYICDKFFAMKNKPAIHLNYLDWVYGQFLRELAELELEVEREIKLPNLRIYYRNRDFDIQEFQRVFLAVKDSTDLVVVDHLHYFDHEDPNENRAIKDIVKKIKDTTEITKVPVVLISHVRKTDKRFKTLLPDIEDFHGSSDIGKIATKAFCLSPGEYDPRINSRHTFINVLKCRADSSRKDWAACIPFNLSAHKYMDEYVLGKVNYEGTEFEPLVRDFPFWSVHAKRNVAPIRGGIYE